MKLTQLLKMLTAFCLIFLCFALIKGQSAPNGTSPTTLPAIQKPHDQKYWAEQKKEAEAITNNDWIDEPWTGNDAPYAAVRAKIDRAVSTTSPMALVAQYAGAAKARPNDPLAQFAWAYAVHNAIKSSDFPAQDAENTRFAAEVATAEVPFPRTYNYARLMFLLYLQAPGGGSGHFLKGTAYRLLQKDPNDFPVLSGLIALDSLNRDKTAQKEGYALIQKMIKKYPEKPQVYDMLGGWYYEQYLLYWNVNDYRLAIANYQRALDAYPTTAARRSSLPQVMSFLTMRYHQISGT